MDRETVESLRIEKAMLVYFVSIFSLGFAFGTIRVLLVEPRLGDRLAELLEIPLMVVAILLIARWLVRNSTIDAVVEWITVGVLALCLLLFAEAIMVVHVRGLTMNEYLANRDPVSGIAYLVGLIVYAAAPACFAARTKSRLAGHYPPITAATTETLEDPPHPHP